MLAWLRRNAGSRSATRCGAGARYQRRRCLRRSRPRLQWRASLPIHSRLRLPNRQRRRKRFRRSKRLRRNRPNELPSELRLDGFDFDFDSLAIGKTARPQPTELPPLELSITEPPPKSPAVPPSAAPADSAIPAMKFEFTDVTQDSPKRMHEDLKLDEALQSFGGGLAQ